MTHEPPPLGRTAVDRAAHLRADDEWVRKAWENPSSRVIVVDGGRALVDANDALVRVPTADAPAGERYFLGVVEESDANQHIGMFAVAATLPDPRPPDTRAATLR